MESECVDGQKVLAVGAIVPSTPPEVRHIPESVDRLLVISLDIQTPSAHLVL